MAVMIIGGSLFLISASIAGIVMLDPDAIIGGVFLMPLLVAVAILQYFAAFRAVRSAATISSIMLYIAGAFATLAFITTAGEAVVVDGMLFSYMYPLLGTMAAIAATFLVSGRANANWSRKLGAACETLTIVHGQGRFGFREVLLGVVAITAISATASYLIYTEPPRYAEHVDRSTARLGLPDGATDVSYYRGFRGIIAYEFTIDESSFREWVESGIGSIESESAGIPLKEIVDPFTIIRYNGLSSELDGPPNITISNGLFYAWEKEDWVVYAAFDRETRCAYYYAH